MAPNSEKNRPKGKEPKVNYPNLPLRSSPEPASPEPETFQEAEENPETVPLGAMLEALTKNTIDNQLAIKAQAEQMQVLQGTILALSEKLTTQHLQVPSMQLPHTQTPSRDSTPELSHTGSLGNHQRTQKLADPTPLSDGVEPAFEAWQIEMMDKFAVNYDHFPTERAKMYYVYNRTTGDARTHLTPRYKPSATNRFLSADGMIKYLEEIYTDPYEEQNARAEFDELQMAYDPHTKKAFCDFQSFKTRFLHLADKARIAQHLRFRSFFEKLTPALRRQYTPLLPIYGNDLKKLLDHVGATAAENTRTRQALAATPFAASSTSHSSSKSPISSTGPTTKNTYTQFPPKNHTPAENSTASKEVICYNCNKPGHIAPDCRQPRNPNLAPRPAVKTVMEADLDGNGGMELYALEEPEVSGKEDA